MTNKAHLGTRHPNIVLVYDNNEDILGASQIITELTEEFKAVKKNKSFSKKISDFKPAVLIFALATLEESVEYYNELITEKVVDYPHQSILFCKNKESGIAFRSCIQGLFDNYFVYQPLYERFRLKMIIHNAYTLTSKESEQLKYTDSLLEQIDDSLASLIEEGGQCKKMLLDSLSHYKKEVTSSHEQAVALNSVQELSEQQVISELNQKHIEPLIKHLEGDILTCLSSLVEQMVTQRVKFSSGEKPKSNLEMKSDSQVISNQESIITEQIVHEELELPDLAALESDELPPPPQKGLLAQYASVNSKKKRKNVLVVEDNKIYREMIANILSANNYAVDQADDGSIALDKIKEKPYDCIIMDLFMPNLDGFNTTKKIKQIQNKKDVPIIALTGNKKKTLLKKWAEVGINAYLVKPSNKEEILAAVGKYT